MPVEASVSETTLETDSRLSEASLSALGLTRAGIEFVQQVSLSPPARKVGSGHRRRNLILEVPMRSIGLVLQAESLTGEYAFLVSLDRDPDLLAAFDQPMTVPIEITDRMGRKTRTTYTADYLGVLSTHCVAYEIKAQDELEQLVKSRPMDWVQEEGRYRYIPAENFFRRLGISHEVVSTAGLSMVLASNLRMLSASRIAFDKRCYRKQRKLIRGMLRNEGTIRIDTILERLETDDVTPVLHLLDQQEAFADLESVLLAEPENVWISLDPSLARIAQEASQQLQEIILKSGCISTDDVIDPRYEGEVANRLALINSLTNRSNKGTVVPSRTVSRYRSAFRQHGIKGLVPLWSKCGNRESRISFGHRAMLAAHIRENRSNPSDPSITSCWNEYKDHFDSDRVRLELSDTRPISLPTYFKYWATTPGHGEDAGRKGGRRYENLNSDVGDPIKKSLLATRPLEVAHIDHWKVDMHLVVGFHKGQKISCRPWLTAMVDGFTGEVLAFWLSFSDPSKKSCSMVIRDCVRRHGRVPEILIVDGGSEFRSVHFSVMLATLGVTLCQRPPEDPRYGKEVERLFGTFKEKFARGLPGYGISIEKCRAVSSAFKANKNASLTLLDATEILERFIFTGYNLSSNGASSATREDMRLLHEARFPHSGIRVEWNQKFLIVTSIEAADSEYKLVKGHGIRVGDRWFTSPKLLTYGGFKKSVLVRLEPFLDDIVYVCVDGGWHVCANAGIARSTCLSDAQLIVQSTARQELSALRKSLKQRADAEAAAIVARELGRITSKQSLPHDGGESSSSLPPQDPPESFNYLPYDFDEIESLEEI